MILKLKPIPARRDNCFGQGINFQKCGAKDSGEMYFSFNNLYCFYLI